MRENDCTAGIPFKFDARARRIARLVEDVTFNLDFMEYVEGSERTELQKLDTQ